MMLCPSCQAARSDDLLSPCPACGAVIPHLEDLPLLAPALQSDAIHFDATAFETLVAVEETSFWFQARNALIRDFARDYKPEADRVLEIGCGSGFVLAALTALYPSARVLGTEAHVSGLEVARRRMPHAHLMQMDGRAIPFRDEFDVAGAFDVIEHIDDDRTVLAQLYAALKPGGILVVTVPQHMFLWSESDDRAGHVRRYTRAELRDKLTQAGFAIRRNTSFVTLLFPALLYARKLRSRRERNARGSELRISSPLDRMLGAVMACERGLIRLGLRFPFGGSLICVAEKPA